MLGGLEPPLMQRGRGRRRRRIGPAPTCACFRFFGGAPKLLVPDNLKSGVNGASSYDLEINRTDGAMAAHYSVGVLPAQPGKPRDKAQVEAGVRLPRARS